MPVHVCTPDDIADRLERVPFSPLHARLMAILGLGMLCDAFDVYVISVAVVTITAFRITDATIGFLVSASYVGQMAGALLFGYWSEKNGRKAAFLWSLGSFGALSIAAAFAWNIDSLVWIRIFQGLGIGALPPIAGAMFSEFLRGPDRGKVGMFLQILYPLGAILSPVVGLIVIRVADNDLAWRLLFLLGGIPVVVAIVGYYLIPESPRWLAANGRIAEANRIVESIEASATTAMPGKNPKAPPAPRGAPSRTNIGELFSPQYIRRTILIWGQSFTAFFILNAYTSFLPRLYTTVGGLSKSQAFALTTIFGICELLLLVVVALTWDRIGRKPWFVWGYIAASIGAAIGYVAFAFFHSRGWVVLATAGMCMALGTYVSVGGVYLYHPELYPTRIRSWATSTGRAVRSIASIISPVLVGQFLTSRFGITGVFAMFFFAALAGLVTLLWFGVETKQAPLEHLAA